MGLTIANEVRRQKEYKNAYGDPRRQQIKERLQQISYSELRGNNTVRGFLVGMARQGVVIKPVINKKGAIYGLRFSYEGQTFKASEIGREFGLRTLGRYFDNLSKASQQTRSMQNVHQVSPAQESQNNSSSVSSSLFTSSYHNPSDDDYFTELNRRKKAKKKKKGYGIR